MDMNKMLKRIKAHPDFSKAGMVLCHNGVVRNTSRDGRRVTGLRVSVNHDRLREIIKAQKRRPGIIDLRIEIDQDRDLRVGDDVMLLAVAGDIRENVIACLSETLNAVKSTVTAKTEYFED
jgi:molybdopterin synthase catalytic subunit